MLASPVMCSFIFIFSNGAIYSISDLCERVRDHIKQCSVVRQGFHHSLKFCTVNEEGFWTQFPRRVLGGFPTPTSKSWMAAGCPAIQLSSDTVLPGDKIDSTRLRAHSTSLPPASGAGANPGCYLRFLTDRPYIRVSCNPSWGSINLPEWFTKLRETFHLLKCQFIIKVY